MKSEFLTDIEAVFEKHGIVDFIIGGVDVAGSIQTVIQCGAGEKSDSNRQRMNDLFGILHDVELQARIEQMKDRDML